MQLSHFKDEVPLLVALLLFISFVICQKIIADLWPLCLIIVSEYSKGDEGQNWIIMFYILYTTFKMFMLSLHFCFNIIDLKFSFSVTWYCGFHFQYFLLI